MENKLLHKFLKFSTQLYLGWVLFIALLTLLPGQAIPDFSWDLFSIDKLVHFTLFAVMAFLGAITMNPTKEILLLKPALISAFLAITYGVMLEYFQTYIPQRAYDYADLIANAVGIGAGILIFLLFQIKLRR